MDQRWLDFFGRLHPFLLHVPIGTLVALLLLEGLGKMSSASQLQPGQRRLLAILLLFASLATATSGWLLGEEQGYSAGVFLWHRGFGIAFAASTALMALATLAGWRGLYRFGLLAALFAVVPAGHFGGSMTHGADFLTEPFEVPAEDAGAAVSVEEASDADTPEELELPPQPITEESTSVEPIASAELPSTETWYDARVAPVLESYCVSCHGAEKQKGDLALHTGEIVLAGSEFGPVVIPGDLEESLLLQRMVVPLEDDDHMPPASKPQPSALELAEVARWISAGASLDAPAPPPLTVEDLPSAPEAEPEPEAPESSSSGSAPLVSVSPDAIEALRADRVHVELIDPAKGLFWVDFRSRRETDDAFVAGVLEVLGDTVAELSLAGTAVSGAVLAQLGAHTQLEELDLSRTSIPGAELNALEPCVSLRELNLTGAAVGDEAATPLAAIAALERVLLWKSGLSAEAIEGLRAARPELEVVTGEVRVLEPAEVEPPVSFSKHPELDPVNTTCPVTGSPIDPRYRVVHDDRVVGFCCPNCPTTFLKAPEKYPVSE